MLAPKRERSSSFLKKFNRSMTNLVLPRTDEEEVPPLPSSPGRERKVSTTLPFPQRLRRMTSGSLPFSRPVVREASSSEVQKFLVEVKEHLSAADVETLAAALDGRDADINELLGREVVVEGETIPLANYLAHVAEHLYVSEKKSVRNMLQLGGSEDGFREAHQRAIEYSQAQGGDDHEADGRAMNRTGNEAYFRVFEHSMVLGDVRNAEYKKNLRDARENAKFWDAITGRLEQDHDPEAAKAARNAGIDALREQRPKLEDASGLVDALLGTDNVKNGRIDIESFLKTRPVRDSGLTVEETKVLIEKVNHELQQDAAYRALAARIDTTVQARLRPGIGAEERQWLTEELKPLIQEFDKRTADLKESLTGKMKQELAFAMETKMRDAGWPMEAIVMMRERKWGGHTLPSQDSVENLVNDFRDSTSSDSSSSFNFRRLDRMVFSKLKQGDLQSNPNDKFAFDRVHKSRMWFRDLLSKTATAMSPTPLSDEPHAE